MTSAFQVSDGILTSCNTDETDLTLPAGIRVIAEGCFAGNEAIRHVNLPDGLISLEEEAFAGCTALQRIELPGDMTEVGPSAFAECSALSEVILPNGIVTIRGTAFLSCTGLRTMVLPETLKTIEDGAFVASGLEVLNLPSAVDYVGERAFWECGGLRKITFPNRDAFIGKHAFGYCPNLCDAWIGAGYPPSADSVEELQYTLFWCSCPEKHSAAVGERAQVFVREHEALIMDWVIDYNNVPALNGITGQGLLSREMIERSLKRTTAEKKTDLTALLLSAESRTPNNWEDDFIL